MRKINLFRGLMAGCVLLMAGTAVQASAYGDDFNDNAMGSQWTLLTDNAAVLTLAEQNDHLQMIAAGPTNEHTDALYLSNGTDGFRLSTAHDFEITLDYSFASKELVGDAGNALLLVFGVGSDETGVNSAAIGFGYLIGSILDAPVALGGAVAAHRTNNTETSDAAGLAATSGTFDITYNAAGDDLTLGLKDGSLSYTLQNTVRGIWNAPSLLASFGGRGNGFSTTGDDAWLDNFTLVSGQTVPEPTGLALFLLATPALLQRKRRA